MLRTLRTGLTRYSLALVLGGFLAPATLHAGPNDSVWIQLFNGTDLQDWDIKFTKSALNVNYKNTFKVVDGLLTIDYSGWTSFNGEFGHAAYKKSFSFYQLRFEYSPGSTQVSGGPAWAIQNNGLMLHSQSISTMTTNQDFPISMETQILGSGNGTPTTMNLCTPGTAFYNTATGGSVNTTHCVNATNATRPAPNAWAWGTVLVLGDSVIKHYTKNEATGTPVFTYYRPVYYGGNVDNPPSGTPANGTRLTGGYIMIQAETANYKFRKIELLNLEGCMTPSDANYKSYFVRHLASACGATAIETGLAAWPRDFALSGNQVHVRGGGEYSLEVADLAGKTLQTLAGDGAGTRTLSVGQAGVYLVRLRNAGRTYSRRAALL